MIFNKKVIMNSYKVKRQKERRRKHLVAYWQSQKLKEKILIYHMLKMNLLHSFQNMILELINIVIDYKTILPFRKPLMRNLLMLKKYSSSFTKMKNRTAKFLLMLSKIDQMKPSF
jgi:hypothetical protein